MKRQVNLLFVLVLCATVAPAMANMTYSDGGTALSTLLNSITKAPHLGDSSVNVATDPLPEGMDRHWHITASSGSVATLVTPLASGNVFGVYDVGDPSKLVPLFTGPIVPGIGSPILTLSTLSIEDTGRVWVRYTDTGVDFSSGWFGYYLEDGSGHRWYSDTSLNGGEDHMVAIQGTGVDTVKLGSWPAGPWVSNEYILAFEDLPLVSSGEYADFAVMVESVQTPVPAAMLLGLLGMSVAGLKLRKFA